VAQTETTKKTKCLCALVQLRGMNVALFGIHLAALCVDGLPAATAHGAFLHVESSSAPLISGKQLSMRAADLMTGFPAEKAGHQLLAEDVMKGFPTAAAVNREPKIRNHPAYAEYLAKLTSTNSLDYLSPTIVEVGVLTGSGLTMWNGLFPSSHIYGFDTQYIYDEKLDFSNANTQVQHMDDRADNSRMFEETLRAAKVNIVADDGDHSSGSTARVFHSISKSLADEFVYYVENVSQGDLANNVQELSKDVFLQACHTCEIEVIPSVGNDQGESNPQGMIVISRLSLRGQPVHEIPRKWKFVKGDKST